MASSPANPHQEAGRRHPAHQNIREQGHLSPVVFVTVCTHGRKKILADAEAVRVILAVWAVADAWAVGRYVILPDHVHLFCSPVRPEVSLRRWIAFWKSRASTHWPRPAEQPVWQREFWDTQLRREESYAAKWEYVRCNPVRHALAARPEDWPWAGEITRLDWHDA